MARTTLGSSPLCASASAHRSLSITGSLFAAALLAGCGGNVIFDGIAETGAGGDGGGTTSSTDPTTSPTTPTTTTPTTTSTTSTTTTTTPTLPAQPTLIPVALGKQPLGSPFSFEVPPGTLGVTLVATVPNNPGGYGPLGMEKMWAPDGAAIINNYSLGSNNKLFFYQSVGIINAGIPQSVAPQTMPVQPGKWSAQVDDFGQFGPPNADVTAYLRTTVDGQFHGGVIDVNVFLVDGVATPDQIKQTLSNSYSNYVGLQLGELNFYALGDQFDSIDENNFYSALHTTSVAVNKPALNLLYVGVLTGQLDGAAGVSSGLPGAAVVHGSNMSGIIAMYFDDPFDATILRHEGGHFGGLFHTSEFEPGNSDYLPDTPVCNDVLAQLDSCPDYDNIMFPTGGNGLGFSPQQVTVLQGSALYRGIYQPGAAPSDPFQIKAPESQGSGATWIASFDGADLSPEPISPDGGSPTWAEDLSSDWKNALNSLVCAQSPGGVASAWSAVTKSLGTIPDSTLLSLARSSDVPSHVRARAISVLGGRKTLPGAISALADIAATESAPTSVRLTALKAVSRGPLPARAALKTRLEKAPSRLVARLAKKLL